jgi:TonB family protein
MSEPAAASQIETPSTDRLVIRIKLVSEEPAPPPTWRVSRVALAIAGVLLALLVGWFGVRSLRSDQAAPQAVAKAPIAAKPAPIPAKTIEPEAPQEPDPPLSAVKEVIPDVPQSALATIRGTVRVVIGVTLDKQGAVIAATADDPGPSRYFERLSIAAARQWTFTPSKSEDQRTMSIRFNFTRYGATANAGPAPK